MKLLIFSIIGLIFTKPILKKDVIDDGTLLSELPDNEQGSISEQETVVPSETVKDLDYIPQKEAEIEDIPDFNTLVEVPVALDTYISYYYPYFYHTHLITFVEDMYDKSNSTDKCDITNCATCNTEKCLKCNPGYFLHDNTCLDYCPEKYLADILRQKCMNENSTDVVYSMAYSIGSCKNMCGKTIKDCSCLPTCKRSGNCCSDYDFVKCDNIYASSLEVTQENIPVNCEFAEKITQGDKVDYKCNQCNDKSFYVKGKCLESCPEGTLANLISRYCKENIKCGVNCESCDNDKCKTCNKGFFLYNHNCVESCPDGYRADRITWTCLEPPVFAWYWVNPTKNSCKNKCGVSYEDCSCLHDCVKNGSCCSDSDQCFNKKRRLKHK